MEKNKILKMKPETKKWLELAKEDYDTAKYNFEGKKYRIAAFLCQQSVEKALKSIMLEKIGKVRQIHDLVELGREVGVRLDILNELKDLTLAYVYSRYPDVIQVNNLKDKASHFLEVCQEILKWVEENL